MRRIVIRSVAAVAVISGVIVTGAGVAAADQERPAGGDRPATGEAACGAGELDFESGCFLGWGRFFR